VRSGAPSPDRSRGRDRATRCRSLSRERSVGRRQQHQGTRRPTPLAPHCYQSSRIPGRPVLLRLPEQRMPVRNPSSGSGCESSARRAATGAGVGKLVAELFCTYSRGGAGAPPGGPYPPALRMRPPAVRGGGTVRRTAREPTRVPEVATHPHGPSDAQGEGSNHASGGGAPAPRLTAVQPTPAPRTFRPAPGTFGPCPLSRGAPRLRATAESGASSCNWPMSHRPAACPRGPATPSAPARLLRGSAWEPPASLRCPARCSGGASETRSAPPAGALRLRDGEARQASTGLLWLSEGAAVPPAVVPGRAEQPCPWVSRSFVQ
jgi:hypothetical protein